MKTFVFKTIPQIQDFQFLTDSSGIILDSAGRLYRFQHNEVEVIPTPTEFTVSQFYFIDSHNGAVAGNSRLIRPHSQEGNLGGFGFLCLAGLLWLGSRRALGRSGTCAAFLLAAGLTASCARLWPRPAPVAASPTTQITRPQLGKSLLHNYVGNKGQRSFIATTHTQGQQWQTQSIPSNFYVSALTAIGRNYLVGTYANENDETVPPHPDGDLWIYGNDPNYTPALAQNSSSHPYSINAGRGVKGLRFYPQDSLLLTFGSETMRTFPRDEISAVPGNIYQLPADLQPEYRIIDVPDAVDVQSLARAGAGELWVTLAGRQLRIAEGKTLYEPLPVKKAFRFRANRWEQVMPNGVASFEQVEFLPGTGTGYLLTAGGEVLQTLDNGDHWHLMSLTGMRKMHAHGRAVTFLQGANELVSVAGSGQ